MPPTDTELQPGPDKARKAAGLQQISLSQLLSRCNAGDKGAAQQSPRQSETRKKNQVQPEKQTTVWIFGPQLAEAAWLIAVSEYPSGRSRITLVIWISGTYEFAKVVILCEEVTSYHY